MQDVSKIYTTQALLHYGDCRYLEAPAGWRLNGGAAGLWCADKG